MITEKSTTTHRPAQVPPARPAPNFFALAEADCATACAAIAAVNWRAAGRSADQGAGEAREAVRATFAYLRGEPGAHPTLGALAAGIMKRDGDTHDPAWLVFLVGAMAHEIALRPVPQAAEGVR